MPVAPLKELVLVGATGGLAPGGRRGRRLGAVVALVAMAARKWPHRRAGGYSPLLATSGAPGARKPIEGQRLKSETQSIAISADSARIAGSAVSEK